MRHRAAAVFAATAASAQTVNLTARIDASKGVGGSGGGPAFVTQNGWNLNLVNEAASLRALARCDGAR